MTLGEKIKNLRAEKNITQEKLAEELNVSRSAIAKWESHGGVPELSNLIMISKLFDVSLDYLVGEEKNKNIKTDEEIIGLAGSAYTGKVCNVDLVGWNDGCNEVLFINEDKDFFYYKRIEKKSIFDKNKKEILFGAIGKKHIKSIEVVSDGTRMQIESEVKDNININYFCGKHVKIELAKKEGIIAGFFDFKDDDYIDVIPETIKDDKIIVGFGAELNISDVTKIEGIL